MDAHTPLKNLFDNINTDILSVNTLLTTDSQDILTTLNAYNNLSTMSANMKLNWCFSHNFEHPESTNNYDADCTYTRTTKYLFGTLAFIITASTIDFEGET